MTTEQHLPGVWEFLRASHRGHQAYVVYPVIEESKLELKAAMEEYERLSREVFPSSISASCTAPLQRRKRRSHAALPQE